MHFFSSPLRCYGLVVAIVGLLALAFSAPAGTESTQKTTAVSARRFTLQQALGTAFQRNPDILRGRQEIRRTRGVQNEVRGQARPPVTATSALHRTGRSCRASGGG